MTKDKLLSIIEDTVKNNENIMNEARDSILSYYFTNEHALECAKENKEGYVAWFIIYILYNFKSLQTHCLIKIEDAQLDIFKYGDDYFKILYDNEGNLLDVIDMEFKEVPVITKKWIEKK